jgi:transcriptional regulator with XRE-family HTH domain
MDMQHLELPNSVKELLREPRVKQGYEESAEVAEICRTLAEARKLVKISQQELAQRSGVDQAEISRIEAGALSRGPTLLTLVRLARAMGMHLHIQFRCDVEGGTVGFDFRPDVSVRDEVLQISATAAER